MTRISKTLLVMVVLGGAASCDSPVMFLGLPIETRLSFTNFSRTRYAALSLRESGGSEADYRMSPLLAPGATFRATFVDFVSNGCPESLDLRLFLYERTNGDVPIGLDDGEAVDLAPVVAGETLGVPACEVQIVETYTIVNWDVEDEEDVPIGRVKIAQSTEIEQAILDREIFDGLDGTWEIAGTETGLENEAPPALSNSAALAGRVTLADGSGVESIGVLIRARFRLRLDDLDESNDPDAGFGDPISVTQTDSEGSFMFDRPPGAYMIEFFSDDFAFRPDLIIVESPIGVIATIAEPIEE